LITAATAALGVVVAPARDESFTVGLAPMERDAVTVGLAPIEGDAVTVGRAPVQRETLTIETVNDARFAAPPAGRMSAAILKAQILLDRAGFSPGAIDARSNGNFRTALAAFQEQHGLDGSGGLDQATWDALVATSAEPVLGEYAITHADTRGPFAPDIPDEIEDRARLKRLSYREPGELLAEKFHMDTRLFSALNPEAALDQPGTRIVVARVGRAELRATVTRIEVDKQQRRLRAYDKDGRLVGVFPASIGSKDKPTPNGAFVVRRIARNPEWRYNPRFAFKEIKATRPFRIAAGPNNPLGTVWIGISARSYGIHGTPVPEEVGMANSHGCVRLTNWDAQALASMVKRGTKVEFVE
jgi:lipoprotein-anchoring transpeptidase ErfK/SrfK